MSFRHWWPCSSKRFEHCYVGPFFHDNVTNQLEYMSSNPVLFIWPLLHFDCQFILVLRLCWFLGEDVLTEGFADVSSDETGRHTDRRAQRAAQEAAHHRTNRTRHGGSAQHSYKTAKSNGPCTQVRAQWFSRQNLTRTALKWCQFLATYQLWRATHLPQPLQVVYPRRLQSRGLISDRPFWPVSLSWCRRRRSQPLLQLQPTA